MKDLDKDNIKANEEQLAYEPQKDSNLSTSPFRKRLIIYASIFATSLVAITAYGIISFIAHSKAKKTEQETNIAHQELEDSSIAYIFDEQNDEEIYSMNKIFFAEDVKSYEEEIEPQIIAPKPEAKIIKEPKKEVRKVKKTKTKPLKKTIAKKPNPPLRYITYDKKDKSTEAIELLSRKDIPATIVSKPYDLSRVVTTDSFIPAVMYTAINSEIPSRTVLAIVESDVVGFHGRNILIPKGSKVEGIYERLENKHARRMQITWFKITRPNGVVITLNAESSDLQGAGGLGGYLDQRLKDRYGGAILLSAINAMAQLSVKENDIRQLAAVESFGREFGTLTAQIVRENINVLPTIMIRQGARFNIRPHQNIYFPQAKNNEIRALFLNKSKT